MERESDIETEHTLDLFCENTSKCKKQKVLAMQKSKMKVSGIRAFRGKRSQESIQLSCQLLIFWDNNLEITGV